jgi:hypothetical protein
MKALTWHGKNDIRCESVPDAKIEHGRDAIIKVTACAICGSDLHLFDGVMPSMEKSDVLGHETMGEVVEVGSENKKLKAGDRVVVPFTISCGRASSRAASAQTPITRWPRSFGATPPRASSAGRLRRRPGGVPPRALCRRRPDQGVRGAQRRTRPLPVGHLSHRLYGGRFLAI